MTVTQTYEFSDNDVKLLQKILPDNPCNGCSDKHCCCGCPSQSKYIATITQYKDAGLYNIACDIKEYHRINLKIECYQKEISELKSKLNYLKSKTPLNELLKQGGLII